MISVVSCVIIATCVAVTWFCYNLARMYKIGTRWDDRILDFLDALNSLYCRFYHRLNPKLLKSLHIPQGGAIVVCNHQSGLDSFLLYALIKNKMHFLIDKSYYDLWFLRWVCRRAELIPVDFKCSNRRKNVIAQSLKALEGDKILAMYPFGGLHFPGHHSHLKMRNGVIELAKTTGLPIIPLHIEGFHHRSMGSIYLSALWRSKIKITVYPNIVLTKQCDEEKAKAQIERCITNDGMRYGGEYKYATRVLEAEN